MKRTMLEGRREDRLMARVSVLGLLLALGLGCQSYHALARDGGDVRTDVEAAPGRDDTRTDDGPLGDVPASGGAGGLAGNGGSGGISTGAGGMSGTAGRGMGGQIDTQTDGKNCGVVGHDCLGGPCTAGQCQPVLIAQYLSEPLSMSIGQNFVCETPTAGQIGCAHKDGSDLRPFANPGETAMAFSGGRSVIEGNRLIFPQLITSGGFQLAICDIGNCESTAQAVGAPYTQYATVDPVAHRVYWIDAAMILYASTAGVPQPAQLSFEAIGAAFGPPIQYSRGSILVTVQGTSGPAIYRIPINANGTTTRPVAIGFGQASVTNDQFVFWDDTDGIRSFPLPNGTGGPSTLVLPGVTNAHLAADQTYLYWSSSPGVATCAIANCAGTQRQLPPGPSTTMDYPFSTHDVAVDDTAIFWVVLTAGDAGQGQIRNSAKIFKLAK
jgi:hypothetical protein